MAARAPAGIEHQHFNDGEEPARWLALIYKPWHEVIGNQMVQVTESPQWARLRAGRAARPETGQLEARAAPSSLTGGPAAGRRRHPARRASSRGATPTAPRWPPAPTWCAAATCPGRSTARGACAGTCTPTRPTRPSALLLVWEQEIPPDSRSGRQLHPVELVHYFLAGEGIHHPWTASATHWVAGDCLALPRRRVRHRIPALQPAWLTAGSLRGHDGERAGRAGGGRRLAIGAARGGAGGRRGCMAAAKPGAAPWRGSDICPTLVCVTSCVAWRPQAR